jgi:hypothetical protein
VSDPTTFYLALCGVGLVGGLAALVRGFAGYRAGALIEGTASSRIATLAAGEVRVSGTVEAAEALLKSPLQDRDCVWYRAGISSSDREGGPSFHEERGIGFRVRDPSGAIRVFPRGARIDVPDQYDEHTGMFGGPPVGLSPRHETLMAAPGAMTREAAVAELLTVHQPEPIEEGSGLAAAAMTTRGSSRRYHEARIEPGDTITIVGSARPFSEIEDPATADALDGSADPLAALDDPEIAADLEAAREAGTLTTREQAWGNALIPGFGIDRPVSEPVLDPAAHHPTLATAAEAARIKQAFDIAPDLLVIASAADAPLLIVSGAPGEAVARDQARFLTGLLGAVVAIVSAVAGAALLTAH